jgi:anti-anti-sigma factor
VVISMGSSERASAQEDIGDDGCLAKSATADPPIVKVVGELDAHSAFAFYKDARRIMRCEGNNAIIDLKDCVYIDSAGIGILFSLIGWARKNGGKVAAVGPRSRVLHVLRLVRLTDERGFQIFADLDSARSFLST